MCVLSSMAQMLRCTGTEVNRRTSPAYLGPLPFTFDLGEATGLGIVVALFGPLVVITLEGTAERGMPVLFCWVIAHPRRSEGRDLVTSPDA